MKRLFCLLQAFLTSIFLSSCGALTTSTNMEAVQTNSKPPVVQNQQQHTEKNEVTIAAAGDIMFHMPQVKSAYNGKSYDFKPVFSDIKLVIESADIAIGNLETTINPLKRLSGFPRFNSPVEILDGIKYAGFDVLTTANNHCMDTGKEGIISTVKNIKSYGIIPIGTGSTNENKYAIIGKNGIKIGILSYTFSSNGIPAPQGMVNYIDRNRIKADIENIKKQCDFTIVCIHAGVEYKREVEPEEQKLFHEIADMGADCIFGGHPHVVRRSEIYNTNGRRVFIIYSLGNFISSQNDKYTDIGVVARVKVVKDNEGVRLKESQIFPVYTLRYKEGSKFNYKVVQCSSIDKYSTISEDKKIYVKNAYNDIINQSNSAILKENNAGRHNNDSKTDSSDGASGT